MRQVFRYQITFRVLPDNATNKKVNFSFDNSVAGFDVSKNGIITVERGGTYTVIIIAADGSNKQEIIHFIILD